LLPVQPGTVEQWRAFVYSGSWSMSSHKAMSSVVGDRRVIKKYPNRRLYDTSSSSYVALGDIKQLVMEGLSFVVLDAKSGSDLTRSILLQIILEEESEGAPLLTEPMLKNMIRFYGHAMQGFMGSFLEKNVQTFMDFQAQLISPSKDLTLLSIVQGVVGRYVDQSTQVLTEIQKQFNKQTEQMMDVLKVKPDE
jgi:polyhydroxyalkanoate synthesis repressor PhaR